MDNVFPVLTYGYEIILSAIKLLKTGNPTATIDDVIILIEKSLDECRRKEKEK